MIKKMYIGLHVKYSLFLLFLYDFNGTCIFSTNVRKILKYQISRKSVQSEPGCSIRTDMTKLTVAFRNSAKRSIRGEAQPRTGHEGPEGQQMYSSNLSLKSALDRSGCSTPRPGLFYLPGQTPSTHCTRDRVSEYLAGPDGCEKPHIHGDSIPGLSNLSLYQLRHSGQHEYEYKF